MRNGIPRPKTYITTKGQLKNTIGRPNFRSLLNKKTMPEISTGGYKTRLLGKQYLGSKYTGSQSGSRPDTLMGKKIPGGWGRLVTKKNFNKVLPYAVKTMGYAKKFAGPGKIVGLATATGALLKEAIGIKKAY